MVCLSHQVHKGYKSLRVRRVCKSHRARVVVCKNLPVPAVACKSLLGRKAFKNHLARKVCKNLRVLAV